MFLDPIFLKAGPQAKLGPVNNNPKVGLGNPELTANKFGGGIVHMLHGENRHP